MQGHLLILALYPRLGKCGGEEGRAVEDQTVQVVSLAEGNQGDVGVPSFEQPAGIQVVGQGYGVVGGCLRQNRQIEGVRKEHTAQVEGTRGVVVGRGARAGHGGLAEQLGQRGHGGALRVHKVHGGALPARALEGRGGVIAALLRLGDLRVQLHDGRVGVGHLEPRRAFRHVW